MEATRSWESPNSSYTSSQVGQLRPAATNATTHLLNKFIQLVLNPELLSLVIQHPYPNIIPKKKLQETGSEPLLELISMHSEINTLFEQIYEEILNYMLASNEIKDTFIMDISLKTFSMQPPFDLITQLATKVILNIFKGYPQHGHLMTYHGFDALASAVVTKLMLLAVENEENSKIIRGTSPAYIAKLQAICDKETPG